MGAVRSKGIKKRKKTSLLFVCKGIKWGWEQTWESLEGTLSCLEGLFSGFVGHRNNQKLSRMVVAGKGFGEQLEQNKSKDRKKVKSRRGNKHKRHGNT